MHFLSQIVIPEPEDRLSVRDISDAWNGRSMGGVIDYQWLLVTLGAVVLLITLISLRQRFARDGKPQPAWWVYRSIGAELSIPRRDQKLLKTIARDQALISPLALLVCRSTLVAHGSAYAQNLPTQAQQDDVKQRVQTLSEQLFADIEPIGLAQETVPDVLT